MHQSSRRKHVATRREQLGCCFEEQHERKGEEKSRFRSPRSHTPEARDSECEQRAHTRQNQGHQIASRRFNCREETP